MASDAEILANSKNARWMRRWTVFPARMLPNQRRRRENRVRLYRWAIRLRRGPTPIPDPPLRLCNALRRHYERGIVRNEANLVRLASQAQGSTGREAANRHTKDL
jgi:hypothetical protein